ncbi:MAG: hypothetical protein KGL39_02805 [Patescibacteria group bacterium]|nr:hypothetical protein [Patescibacteria group bacterium]
MSKSKVPPKLEANQRLVNGEEYLEYCRRAQAGEFHIPTVELRGNARYLVTLSAPLAPERTADETFEELFS